MILINSFSANMLAECPANVRFVPLSAEGAAEILRAGFESAVGHADTAAVFSAELGVGVP